jgi:hypothetical protein
MMMSMTIHDCVVFMVLTILLVFSSHDCSSCRVVCFVPWMRNKRHFYSFPSCDDCPTKMWRRHVLVDIRVKIEERDVTERDECVSRMNVRGKRNGRENQMLYGKKQGSSCLTISNATWSSMNEEWIILISDLWSEWLNRMQGKRHQMLPLLFKRSLPLLWMSRESLKYLLMD